MMPQTFPLFFNAYALPFLVACLLIAFMGIYVGMHATPGPQKNSFLVLSASFFVWLGGTFVVYSIRSETYVMPLLHAVYAGVALISPSLYWYASAWLGCDRKNRSKIVTGYVLALLITVLISRTSWIVIGASKFPWGYHSRLTVLGGSAFLCFFMGYMALFFYTLYCGYRCETSASMKRQILLVGISFLIANIGSSDFIACYGVKVFPLGGLVMTLGLSTLAYTIIRYKMLEIETVVHKTMLWFASTLVTLVPFAAFINVTQGWMRSLAPMLATLYFTMLAVAFYFYFRAIQPRLGQLFRRRHADLMHAEQAFAKELVHLKSMRDLLQGVTRLLRKTVYVREMSLYLRDETENRFVPAIVKRRHGLKPVACDHPFLKWLEVRDQALLGDYAESDPEVAQFKEEMKEYFHQMGAVLAMPFVIAGKMIGILHLGKKENLQRYTPAERGFLAQIKVPVTIAFSNSLQFENVTRLYQQVQHQNERLQELDRLKSQFLANTSHELRTPLNGILGLVEAILDGADGEVNDEQTRHLRMILESGAGLKELINNLLELSRLESGQMRLDIKRFNVANVIDAVTALLEGVARKKNVQLLRDLPPGLADVYGDPEKIQRVLINLVGNALKFTEKGAVTVRVQDTGGCLQVEVQDTGIGISEKDLRVIFERFRQADGGDTRHYEGTGLGLSIAREMVRLHGADIQVSSRVGQGSLFAFTLSKQMFQQSEGRPVSEPPETPALQAVPTSATTAKWPAKEAAPAEAVYELAKDPEFTEAVRGDGELVLVIDDNPVNREVIRTRLGMHNYEVTEAVDGVQGLEKVQAKKPALVILDLMMPRMSGYEFCKRVRAQYSSDDLPIIMLTAKTDMGDKVYGLQIGANDYISKPFQQEELLARVSVLLKIRRLHEELRHWNAELENRVSLRTRELEDTQKQLIQAEKMATIGTFAGGIAHEINNPLTAVLTNAQILKMGSPNPDDIELIDLIEEGARRCQVIIKKLMKYARKEVETAQIREVSLKKVVENVAAMLGYQLKNDNVELEIDANEIGLVWGNEGELEQVFTNLILNARDAIHAAKRAQGFIRIQGSLKENSICVEVIDNGCGIKTAHLSKIFDPFFTTKDVGSGTGLGLAVVHSILEKHGCRVRVESEEGIGTTFLIYFPLSANGHS